MKQRHRYSRVTIAKIKIATPKIDNLRSNMCCLGSKGVLEIDLRQHEGNLKIYPRYGSKNELSHEHFDYHRRSHCNGDLFIIQHYFDLMYGAAEPVCTVEDGYTAMVTAASASKSSEWNKMIDVI